MSQEANPRTLVNQLCLNRNPKGACIWLDRKNSRFVFADDFCLGFLCDKKKQLNSCIYARSVGRWIDFQKPIGNSKGFQRKCVFLDKDPKKKRCGFSKGGQRSPCLRGCNGYCVPVTPCDRDISWLLRIPDSKTLVQLASISILHRVKSLCLFWVRSVVSHPIN